MQRKSAADMTLRELFACVAMHAMLSRKDLDARLVAFEAARYADELMKELEARKDGK